MAVRKKKSKDSIYRSGYEQTVTDILRTHGVAHEYETVKVKYTKPSTDHTYKPDILLPNGIICELKGYMDLDTKKKMLLVIAQNPGLDIRMVFQNPKCKISKKSSTTYADWATKNKIRFGTPQDIIEWAKEKPRA